MTGVGPRRFRRASLPQGSCPFGTSLVPASPGGAAPSESGTGVPRQGGRRSGARSGRKRPVGAQEAVLPGFRGGPLTTRERGKRPTLQRTRQQAWSISAVAEDWRLLYTHDIPDVEKIVLATKLLGTGNGSVWVASLPDEFELASKPLCDQSLAMREARPTDHRPQRQHPKRGQRFRFRKLPPLITKAPPLQPRVEPNLQLPGWASRSPSPKRWRWRRRISVQCTVRRAGSRTFPTHDRHGSLAR